MLIEASKGSWTVLLIRNFELTRQSELIVIPKSWSNAFTFGFCWLSPPWALDSKTQPPSSINFFKMSTWWKETKHRLKLYLYSWTLKGQQLSQILGLLEHVAFYCWIRLNFIAMYVLCIEKPGPISIINKLMICFIVHGTCLNVVYIFHSMRGSRPCLLTMLCKFDFGSISLSIYTWIIFVNIFFKSQLNR